MRPALRRHLATGTLALLVAFAPCTGIAQTTPTPPRARTPRIAVMSTFETELVALRAATTITGTQVGNGRTWYLGTVAGHEVVLLLNRLLRHRRRGEPGTRYRRRHHPGADGGCLPAQPKIVVGGNGVSGPTFVDNAAYRDWSWRTFRTDAAHPVLKVATGRGREVRAAQWVLAIMSLAFYLVYPF